MALGAGGAAQAAGHLDEERAIGNRVHGIEAQAVDAIVEQPHQGVLMKNSRTSPRRKSMAWPQGVCRSSRKNAAAYCAR